MITSEERLTRLLPRIRRRCRTSKKVRGKLTLAFTFAETNSRCENANGNTAQNPRVSHSALASVCSNFSLSVGQRCCRQSIRKGDRVGRIISMKAQLHFEMSRGKETLLLLLLPSRDRYGENAFFPPSQSQLSLTSCGANFAHNCFLAPFLN